LSYGLDSSSPSLLLNHLLQNPHFTNNSQLVQTLITSTEMVISEGGENVTKIEASLPFLARRVSGRGKAGDFIQLFLSLGYFDRRGRESQEDPQMLSCLLIIGLF
jgi:hypothetical protein